MSNVIRWPVLELAHGDRDIAEAERQIAAIQGRVDRLDATAADTRQLSDILTELRAMIQRHRAARERIAAGTSEDEGVFDAGVKRAARPDGA